LLFAFLQTPRFGLEAGSLGFEDRFRNLLLVCISKLRDVHKQDKGSARNGDETTIVD